jgi:succinate dehydrogenase flavin-adding protein (antitoxin of CptAB toxin-antitoxin module)
MSEINPSASGFDPVELKRIRWHSRRGLLELDLVFERFLAKHFDSLNAAEMAAYVRLLDLPDNDLLDVVNARAEVTDPELQPVVDMLRQV